MASVKVDDELNKCKSARWRVVSQLYALCVNVRRVLSCVLTFVLTAHPIGPNLICLFVVFNGSVNATNHLESDLFKSESGHFYMQLLNQQIFFLFFFF